MKLYTEFPEFIYEALITSVDFKKGICSLSPLSPGLDNQIENVPLPHHLGIGNSGIFHGLEVGSRVIAANTKGSGREFSVILSTLPKEALYKNAFRSGRKPDNTPAGTLPYPELEEGRMVFRGGEGNALWLMEDGDIDLSTAAGSGLFYKKDRLKFAQYSVAEMQIYYSNAGKHISGGIKRTSPTQMSLRPPLDVGETPIESDLEFHTRSVEIGFFSGTKVYNRKTGLKTRNPLLAEKRSIVNEFSVDSKFAGFDNELLRGSSLSGVYAKVNLNGRYKDPGNTLDLGPGQLLETISGNVVSITGKILDINYNPLSYGRPQNRAPLALSAETIEISKKISRRGIGHHFQLSTASVSTEKNNSTNNFVFDIDKEGSLKINIPRSSDTGNIFYSSMADFSTGTPTVSYTNESSKEFVPVVLRNEFGDVLLPKADWEKWPYRETGIRFSNTDTDPYFPSGTESASVRNPIRINQTKYHNMYATAERLLASMIDKINIPESFVDENGLATGLAALKSYEVLYPEEYYTEDESNIDPDLFPRYMSVAIIQPQSPAIYTGGDTVVGGMLFNKDVSMCSNSFKLQKDGNGFSVSTVDSQGNPLRAAGGVSAHLNIEGAIYTSIGADNIDKKSVMVDTQGSIVSWFGKDKHGRSIITQTDGDVLINVGGSYEGAGSSRPVMNTGRLELRVNVTDKKFLTTDFNTEEGDITEDNANPGASSDIIISLSENGIVIAGMKPGIPMVIRNHDKILIESASEEIILKGTDVRFIDASGRTKTIKSEGR